MVGVDKGYWFWNQLSSCKENVVVDALSRRSHLNRLIVEMMSYNLCEEFDKLNLWLKGNRGVVAMEADSTLP
jgi:hypothetical protein